MQKRYDDKGERAVKREEKASQVSKAKTSNQEANKAKPLKKAGDTKMVGLWLWESEKGDWKVR